MPQNQVVENASDLVRRLLESVEYDQFCREKLGPLNQEELHSELLRLSLPALRALEESFTLTRKELCGSGTFGGAFRVDLRSLSDLKDLLKKDAYFDLRGIIFTGDKISVSPNDVQNMVQVGFRETLTKDFLAQGGFWDFGKNGFSVEEITEELNKLSLRALLSLYEAYINTRRGWWSGYERLGFTDGERPNDAVRAFLEIESVLKGEEIDLFQMVL